MNWNTLQHPDQLADIIKESSEKNILIFKHSTSCSISVTSLNRLERNWEESEVPSIKPYFLDLLSNRQLSNAVAEEFGVRHESPQVLLINRGRSIYDRSHFDISFNDIKTVVRN